MVDTTEFNLVPNNEEEEFTVDFGEVIRLAGSSDFDQLQNRPQYDGQVMTGETDIPKVPTATSELNNDSDYQTGSEVQQTINAAIADKQDKLTAGQNITISEQNVISATGLTEVDWGDIGGNLNDQIDLKDVLDAKQDTLTPGDNVTIANNIISATDTKYTAGNGLSLNGTQFSADTTVLQEKLDAGNAITIENNTINADIYPADFFTNDATATDTGSNITLDKTIPATLKSVELKGDTDQQTYSGKNKIGLTPYYTGGNIYNREPGEVFPNTTSSDVVISNQTNSSITFTSTVNNAGILEVSSPLSEGEAYVLSASLTASGSIRTTAYTLNSSHEIVRRIGNTTSSLLRATVTMQSGELYIAYAARGNESNYTFTIDNLQLETGSTATDYEPYVGGVPAPNPDYPQDVEVVTGEQTVTVNGKNLIDYLDDDAYSPNSASAAVGTDSVSITKLNSTAYAYAVYKLTADKTNALLGKTVSISYDKNLTKSGANSGIAVFWVAGGSSIALGTQIASNYTTTTGAQSFSFDIPATIPDGTKPQIALLFYPDRTNVNISDSAIMTVANLQLEYGSTATEFQPYQTPQSYTVDLGSTELCKIGDYEDYIYKSGGDWYVHKACTSKIFDGSENWTLLSSTIRRTAYYVIEDNIASYTDGNEAPAMLSDHFISTSENSTWVAGLMSRQTNNSRIMLCFDPTAFTTLPDLRNWLSTHNTTVYYPLATPTDTKITDAGLIADLNALAGAKSYLDVTNFSVAATGTNLPALLKPEVYVKSLNGVLEYLSHI